MYRLSAAIKKESNIHTAFGHALGAGIQELFKNSTTSRRAYLAAFMAWDIDLLESHDKAKKNFWEVLRAIDAARAEIIPAMYDWELAYFNGKPAAELGLKIRLPGGYRYRGYIDLVLKHKTEPMFKVLELKSTGSTSLNEAQYQNSFQGVGYGVVLDKLAADIQHVASYAVDYIVYQTAARSFTIFPFLKTNLQRMEWLNQLLIETEKIELYERFGQFPKHGESCYSFYRQCEYFGICGMSNTSIIASEQVEYDDEEDDGHYDFVLNFDDLLNQQESALS